MVTDRILNAVCKIAEVQKCQITEGATVLIEFTICDNGKSLTFGVPLNKSKDRILFNMLTVEVDRYLTNDLIHLGSCMHVLTIIQRELMRG